MNQSLLAPFGTAIERVEAGLAALRQGQGVLVVDDEDRENEGDLIFAAESLTNAQMAMLIRECSGIVCLCLPDEKVKALELPPMVENNSSQYGTAFARPGHVYPLRAQPGGVLTRRGHTEGTIDLMQLAGLKPAGVLCEVTNPDGTMARLPEIIAFGAAHKMPVLTIEDIVVYRKSLLANVG